MKQFLILFFISMMVFSAQNLVAQGKNNEFDSAEKADTIVYAILGAKSESGSECGHRRSSDGRPAYRLIITDIEGNKPGEGATLASKSYQAKVSVYIKSPFKKTQSFTFKKFGKGKKGSVWAVDIPCSTKEATFTIDLLQKKNGKIKPVNLNAKGNKNPLTLSVDFSKGKIYTLSQGKSLLGGFNKKLSVVGKKMGNADKGSLKIKVE